MHAATATLTSSPCDLCPVARQRSDETGDAVECDCGRRHDPPPVSGVRLVDAGMLEAALSMHRAGNGQGAAAGTVLAWAPRRPRPVLAFRGFELPEVPDEERPPVDALAVAAERAAADPELVRVRVLLAALRPDCADPWSPPVVAEQPAQMIRVRDPMAGWGDVPRGLESGFGAQLAAAEAMQARGVADVLAEVDALPAPAPRVLRWARGHARLAQGLRGLYVDAGLWAGATGDDLGARREAAYLIGRRVLLGAAGAWGR